METYTEDTLPAERKVTLAGAAVFGIPGAEGDEITT